MLDLNSEDPDVVVRSALDSAFEVPEWLRNAKDAWREGDIATLKRIAATRGRDFYEGETAHKLVAHAQAHEAAMTLADLRDYAPEWVTPISQSYRGHTLHQIPPNGQGIAALIALGILQNFDLAARPNLRAWLDRVAAQPGAIAIADAHP